MRGRRRFVALTRDCGVEIRLSFDRWSAGVSPIKELLLLLLLLLLPDSAHHFGRAVWTYQPASIWFFLLQPAGCAGFL
jgi:hypothetical protein